ncbi:hypothetical protein [Profundibacter amoris]|uniref:Uncharacterized protein n=1 Tax=Profundibacter amoris TaxID=2171755 RepID=A0A347UG43_9RHOB|nr:hypothetical protein [Profundibacter amoris]AXX97821.1 hypothetical protein BAR1_07695 [Profundibacter amoris]
MLNNQKSICAALRFEPEYRFRLWQALIDDIELLGVGHGKYLDQIHDSFSIWHETGYDFHHPNGNPIDLDALTKDDLYGFIRGYKSGASGPTRKISHNKVAVLDVFLKAKYPYLVAAFDQSKAFETLLLISNALFGNFAAPVARNASGEFLNDITGVYILKTRDVITGDRFKTNRPQIIRYGIPVIIITETPTTSFCVVHKLIIPIAEKYFSARFLYEIGCNSQFPFSQDPASTTTNQDQIFSGVAVPGRTTIDENNWLLNCLCRERSTYEPYFMSLAYNFAQREEVNKLKPLSVEQKNLEASEYLFQTFNCKYLKVDIFNVYSSEKMRYSGAFYDHLKEYYHNLGAEI